MATNDNDLREFACARCRLVMRIGDDLVPKLPEARMCKCSGCGVDLLVWRHPKPHRGFRSSVLNVHKTPIPLTEEEQARIAKRRTDAAGGALQPGLVDALENMTKGPSS